MGSRRHPHRNAAIPGLLQGVPQGLMVTENKTFMLPGFNVPSLVLIICFGLFGSPRLALPGPSRTTSLSADFR